MGTLGAFLAPGRCHLLWIWGLAPSFRGLFPTLNGQKALCQHRHWGLVAAKTSRVALVVLHLVRVSALGSSLDPVVGLGWGQGWVGSPSQLQVSSGGAQDAGSLTCPQVASA